MLSGTSAGLGVARANNTDHLDGCDGFDTCTGTVGVDVFVSREVIIPA